MLVTCPNCGRVVSTRAEGVGEGGRIACACGAEFRAPAVEGPSRWERAAERVYWSVGAGLVAGGLGAWLGLALASKGRMELPGSLRALLAGGAIGSALGAVLGPRFLDWLLGHWGEDR